MRPNHKPYLHLPIETKVREFHGKLLFSLIAAENGFNVILGGQHMLREQLQRFPRGVYIDKSVSVRKNKWFRNCRRLGNVVTAWDEEGLLFFDADMYHQMRLSTEALDQIQRFFAWGNVQKEAICQKIPAARKLVNITGNPRFDMLRPEFRDFYRDEADEIKEKYGRIILVNTNFQLYNFFDGPAAARKALETYPIARSNPKFYDGWIEISRKMFAWFARMVAKLSMSFPKHTIILRPHPSENRQIWRDILKGFHNVNVIGEGNVIHWIMASEVMIHFNCTTGVEAFLLDVPAIDFRPLTSGYYEQHLPNALSIQVSDLADLMETVEMILKKGRHAEVWQNSDEREKTVMEYIYGYRGALASENIIDAIKNLDVPPAYERTPAQRYYQLERAVYWALYKRYTRIMFPHSEKYNQQKFPGLDILEIQKAHNKLKVVSGRFSDIQIKSVSKSCFEIFSS